VIRYAIRGVGARPLLSLGLCLVLITVAAASAGIATFARTMQADFVGDAQTAWATPYDLLVRPAGSRSRLESDDGLVRPNFIAGLKGGITLAELEAIRAIPGIEVAAPIAIVGAVNTALPWVVPLPSAGTAVFHVTVNSTADANQSHYPVDDRYIVISHGSFHPTDLHRDAGILVDPRGRVRCDAFSGIQCFAAKACIDARCSVARSPLPGFDVSEASYSLYVMQPLVIAGIDPASEAALLGLDRCVTAGRYLATGDGPADLDPTGTTNNLERIPVLRSADSFVDERLELSVQRAVDVTPMFEGGHPKLIRSWTPAIDDTRTARELYQAYLSSAGAQTDGDPYPIWSAGDVEYELSTSSRLRPGVVNADPTIWLDIQGGVGVNGPEAAVPPAARDTAFREVTTHRDGYRLGPGSPYRLKNWDTIGTYDPSCLPGWSPVAGGNLDTYTQPSVELPNGSVLTPSRSLSGYVGSPPLMLVSLESAAWLSDPARYLGQPGNAFISAIRIRVAGVTQPTSASEAKLAEVAAEIRSRTGLDVDVVKGSSGRPIQIDLAAGKFGRPQTMVTEDWSVKGVVVRFVNAVGGQAVALTGIAFVMASVFIATASSVAMRRRRREFKTLRALGWSRLRLATLVELEIGVVGAIGALAVLATAIPASHVLGPGSAENFAASAAIALCMALFGGLITALLVLRQSVARAGPANRAIRATRTPINFRAFALRHVFREARVESTVAVVMIGIGSAVLGLLVLVAVAFNGQLDATVLGQHFATKAEPYHFAAAALLAALGAIENAQVVVLSYVERRQSLATLRAVGWSASSMRNVLGIEGVVLTAAGVCLGTVAVAAFGSAAGAPLPALAGAALAGSGSAVIATACGLLIALWSVTRRPLLDGLRED
jgi:hypothetical protein